MQPLGNLKRMDLCESKHLKELPNLSTATNLEKLTLFGCSSLAELPSSLGNLQKLQALTLRGCLKLEALPTNINLESLDYLDLTDCLLIKTTQDLVGIHNTKPPCPVTSKKKKNTDSLISTKKKSLVPLTSMALLQWGFLLKTTI